MPAPDAITSSHERVSKLNVLMLLDRAMLWVARAFTGFNVIRELFWPSGKIGLACLPSGFEIDAFLLIYLSWAVGICFLKRDVVRLYLGLSAVLVFLTMVFFVAVAFASFGLAPFKQSLSLAFIFGGLFSLIWVAVRGPLNDISG